MSKETDCNDTVGYLGRGEEREVQNGLGMGLGTLLVWVSGYGTSDP